MQMTKSTALCDAMNLVAGRVAKDIRARKSAGTNAATATFPCHNWLWIVDISYIMHRGKAFLPRIFYFSSRNSYLQEDRSIYRCREQVEKQLPHCEHRVVMDCCQDPSEIRCQVACSQTMECCQQACKSRCYECQQVSPLPGTRNQHKGHPCGRIMHCQHPCSQLCDVGHKDVCGTADCQAPCRQSCSHHLCPLGCSTPCTPCVMSCPWKCEHHECLVPCGSVSTFSLHCGYGTDSCSALCAASLRYSLQ